MDTPSIRQIRQSSFRSQTGRSTGRRFGDGVGSVIEEDSISSGSISSSASTSGKSPGFRSISIGSVRNVSNSGGGIENNRKTSFSEASIPSTFEPSKSGVIDLTKNARYCVSRLPATPPVLSGSVNLDSSDYENDDIYTGFADQTTSFALVSSPSSSYVWTYTSPDHIPTTMSFPSDTSDTLSVLVSPAPGTQEPGLVSIIANTGLLTYWESVGGAIANELLKRRKSINHEVKLYSGEVIDNIQAIEPAGIVVTTTSGRFILITLRDLYGKQSITSSSMRGGGPGLLSSIKNAIVPSSSRRGIVSVKPGTITGRTERQVLFINQSGDLSIWECSRAGRSRVLFEGRLHELMLNHISPLYNDAYRTFKVHDVELYEQQRCIFVLSSFEYSEQEMYYVLFTILIEGGTDSNNDVKLLSAHRLQMFTSQSSSVPRLIFPKPYKTLFVIFSEAVVLLDSMTVNINESSSSSSPSGILRRWEDVISFKSGVEIVGASGEDLIIENAKTIRNCGIIALIRNIGVVRIERFADSGIHRTGDLLKRQEALEPELAKSRIEQAVFYGSEDEGNPLSFDNRPEIQLDSGILEESFLKVSKEILETRSVYMPPILPSLSEHLSLRVLYLSRLANYLHANFVRVLSVKAKFQLLWDLEKATAAKALWGYIDSKLQQQADNSKSILLKVISKNSPSNGDGVRDWFVNKTSSLDKILIETAGLCASSPTKGVIIEGNNAVLLAIHDAALNTRAQYGGQTYYLFPDDFCDLEPWTSTPELLNALENQYKLTVKLIASEGNNNQELERQLIQLTETLCSVYTERIDWTSNSDSSRRQGTEVSAKYTEQRSSWIRLLVKLDYSEDALRIAEQFQIYRSLVEILVENWNVSKNGGDDISAQRFHNKIESYFETFGYDFASVLYQYFVETKQLKSLLTEFPNYNVYLDRFFGSGRHGRISWVRDIQQEDYIKAGKVLSDVALNAEDLNSNRKLELSIAKLSTLAGNSNKQDDDANEILETVEARLQTINIQESISEQIEGYVNPSTNQRYQVYSNDLTNSIKSLPIHTELVKRGLSKVVQKKKLNGEELIDTLTLIDTTTKDSNLNFFRAFQVLDFPGVIIRNKSLNEKLIWRRLLLRDDWQQIVDTKRRSDAKVQSITEKTVLYQTLKEFANYKQQSLSKNDDNQPELLTNLSSQIVLDPSILIKDTDFDKSILRDRLPYLDDAKLTQLITELDSQTSIIQNLVKNFSLSFWTKGIYSTVLASRTSPADGMDVDQS